MGAEPTAPRSGAPSAGRRRALLDNRRALAGLILGTLIVVFAVVNLDEVRVNWILGTWNTPLIVVIGASFVLGALVGAAVAQRRRKPARPGDT